MRIDDAAFLHFKPKVVAFASALAHAGEHRNTAVLHGDVVDQFHDDDGLADACATEQADLAAAQIRLEQIDHLDTGLKHFETGRLIFKGGRGPVDGQKMRRVDRAHIVHRLPDHIEHAAQRFLADRDRDRHAEADRLHTAHHAFGGLHGDGADATFADVLRRFADDVDRRRDIESFAGNADRREDLRNMSFRKLAVDGWSRDLDHLANDVNRCCYCCHI